MKLTCSAIVWYCTIVQNKQMFRQRSLHPILMSEILIVLDISVAQLFQFFKDLGFHRYTINQF